MKKIKRVLLLLTLIVSYSSAFAEEARLLRFPSISDKLVVFSYGGDLYSVSPDGGTARRLTSHIGYEMFPKISPDGKLIAFTAQYDGNTEVYVIPSEGGIPKRVTFTATLGRDDVGDRMGPNNIVLGWTPDGKNILYRTRAFTFNDFTGQLMTVSISGGLPQAVPLKNGGFASFDPKGKKLAYNYIFREFRTWKRYKGGMADDIRVFDFDTKKSERITDNTSQDIFPMWSQDGSKIFYISDREDYMNLYSYDVNSKKTTKHTEFNEYDIKFPSIGSNAIVYENGGYIYKYDIVSGKNTKLKIEINNDLLYNREEWKDLSKSISAYSISPNGERLLVTARGDIFSVPSKAGVTYNLSNSCESNEKFGSWSPDGQSIAYVSDKGGEFNIYIKELKSGVEKQLTNVKTNILGIEWSPDSKSILWSDKNNNLTITDVKTGSETLVEKSEISPMNDYNWSPDSKLIIFTRPGKTVSTIVVYSIADKQKIQITDEWYSSGGGNFSKDGKHIVFTSARTFNPTYSNTEWNHAYTNMNKIYVLPITKDAEVPFALKNDTVAVEKQAPADKTKEAKATSANTYYFDNISSRIVEIPVQPSFYGNLHMIGKTIYYGSRRGSGMYDLDSQKETDLQASLIFGPAYKKAIALTPGSIQIIDIPKAPIAPAKGISLAGVKKLVNYNQEWIQIYNETWRQMRDYFYAKNMHGVDWNKMKKRYEVLVPHVAHRSDLTYIIGELIGELNVGHAYSQNGEHPEAERVLTGLLGADLVKADNGYYKITKIIAGANWSKETRSPLTMPGVELKEGDFILAINGNSVKESSNIYELLAGTAGITTELTVNSIGTEAGARKVLVEPLADESQLRYYSWVENNLKKVNEATNGEVGYIHIPDMGVAGLNEFVKHYYPQLTKKALIIDDRGNGGGNVSPMLIERLQRTITFFTMHTNQTEGSVSPVGTFQGPKVLLINEYSASDGDLFPYRFKFNKLGTVIGRRTWGGVVGYSGTVPVVDGGSIVTPSYAPFAADGSGFIIEGEGVTPDIDLENDPYKEFNGQDEQLTKAIEVALKQMKEFQYKMPIIPKFPDKSPKK